MKILMILGIAVLVSACTIARPLKLPEGQPADQKVFVSITDAVYRKDLVSRMRFWRQTFSVVDTLSDQPGFLAFSSRIELVGNRASTMTAWTDRASMREFAYGDGLHTEVVEKDTTLIDAKFYGGEFDPGDLPSWEEALDLLYEHGRHYYE